jgi:hypothetical protein
MYVSCIKIHIPCLGPVQCRRSSVTVYRVSFDLSIGSRGVKVRDDPFSFSAGGVREWMVIYGGAWLLLHSLTHVHTHSPQVYSRYPAQIHYLPNRK